MKFTKRDVVLWLRHLHECGLPIPQGRAALFRLGAADVLFEPMRPSPGGRLTPGLRATGSNRGVWTSIPLGTAVELKLIRVLDEGAPAPVDPVLRPPRVSAHPYGPLDSVELPTSRRGAFDAYLMIDWSASSTPKTGRDSIWWCLCVWRDGHIVAEVNENSPTRQTCFDAVRARLAELVANGCSVLLAFDFPYGYPAGFARALRLSGAPWRAVWDELRVHIADEQAAGTNNRFDVASDLNRRIGAAEGPFWGHPHGRTYARLRPREAAYPVSGLARLREADRHARGVQPVWKLWGNGSVGSQSLLGIPLLARLRDDNDLRRASAVWPFETGSVLPPRDQEPRIIFAEIYPSLVPLPPQLADCVKDSVQVEAIGWHLARHDAADTLRDLFAAPTRLESAARRRVEEEEGWILGVMPSPTRTR
jgi:precorrin-8X/cobalt-precorrin-8 methylmutase